MRRSRHIARHNRKHRGDSTAVVPYTDDIDSIGTQSDSSWRSRNSNTFKQKVEANLVRFHREILTLHFSECDVCREAWLSIKVCVQGELSICNRCQSKRAYLNCSLSRATRYRGRYQNVSLGCRL